MPKTTVHMIGQAHLDPVWLWRWTEGRAEALATCASAADRLDEYPAFQFTRGESQIYAWVAQENPPLLARIREHIAQGRWHVVNGMVIQPDMNMPNGESFVRQILLGKAWMREHLGLEPRIAYCVDSFGHAGTLPQILRQCGFDYYVFMRPQVFEKQLPANAFWWQGPDGSRILAFRISGAYTTRSEDQRAHIGLAVADMPPVLHDTMCFYGVGNHGGGPTRAQIEDIARLAAQAGELEIRFSSPQAYFAAIEPAAALLPTVAEELQFHAVGCYSAVSALKQAHRQAENRLLLAERMLALAERWAGRPILHQPLRALWHDLCLNQFHDTLGGSSLKPAEDDAIRAFGRIVASCDELVNDAGRAVAAFVDTRGPGGSVLLFNPLPEPAQVYVEYEPWTDWVPWERGLFGLLDDENQPVPYQVLETEAKIWGGMTRLLVRAALPPLGYRLYRFAPDAPQPERTGSCRATPTTLENDLLALRLDPHSGAIVSCVEKASGRELVGAGGWNVPQVLDDYSDTWSHHVRRYEGMAAPFGTARIGIGEDGPLQASLLIERRGEYGAWQQQMVVRHGERELLIRNWLNWNGQWKLVKLAFDLQASVPHSFHDAPFGWVERPCDGAEVPTQMWMAVQGEQDGQQLGAALINDGKYGCDVRGSSMRLTILRAVPYAYHIPHRVGAHTRYEWLDQGAQEFTLLLKPFVGDWRDAGVVRRARELHLPPVAITSYAHAGDLPPRASLLALEAPELELTALKPANDGDGYIVRLADRHGRGGVGTLFWHGQRFPVAAAPFQVITVRLRRQGEQWQVQACDMLERTIDDGR